MKYSSELTSRYIKYFKEEHSTTFSEEEAQEGLENLAGLYLAFSDMITNKKVSKK